jgi:hypothetical protein
MQFAALHQGTGMLPTRLAVMKIACLIGRHWPEAAFSPARDGHEASQCVDCGAPMFKTGRSDWRVVQGSNRPSVAGGPQRRLAPRAPS